MNINWRDVQRNNAVIRPGTISGESSPPAIEGGSLAERTKTHSPAGTQVSYTCHNGYHMIGSDVSVCLGNGSWSTPPICTRGKCIFKQCFWGFKSSGVCFVHIILCEWHYCMQLLFHKSKISFSVCSENLPRVMFGSSRQPLTNTAPYFAGERMEYECESGYEMEKKNYITCQPDGTWSNSPKCIPVLKS